MKAISTKIIIIITLTIVIILVTSFLIFDKDSSTNQNQIVEENQETFEDKEAVQEEEKVIEEPKENSINWVFTNNEWTSSTTPPTCPKPIFNTMPIDISKATSVLYPGQVRGNDYKPHGGFRFDNSDTNIIVTAPLDAKITRASRYLQDGDVQYLFEFRNDCGMQYRFDHLKKLSPKLEEIANTLPESIEGDSRTTDINGKEVKEGDTLAFEVGSKENIFVDFGVYDLRQKNQISSSANWNPESIAQASYAICWLSLLPEKDEILKLPGLGSEGKTSDYC